MTKKKCKCKCSKRDRISESIRHKEREILRKLKKNAKEDSELTEKLGMLN